MATTPTSRTLKLDSDRTVEVLEAGEGAPLLFLHSAGGIGSWEGALPALAERFHVHAPLLPGFGKSTGLEVIDDSLDLALHGFDIIDALGIERPYVVGESFGGWLAAEMATLRPKEISRLALAAPVGVWRDDKPVRDIFGETPAELLPALFHDPEGPAAQQMGALAALFTEDDSRTDEQVEMIIEFALGLRTAAKFLFPVPDTGIEKRLHRIQAPTLVCWGKSDRLIDCSYANIFAQRIPNAKVELIENAGHVIGLEQPEAYSRALLGFANGG